MEVGTFESEQNKEEKRRKRKRNASRPGRGGKGKGNDGGGGNDGGDGPERHENGEYLMPGADSPDKSRILMWFLLLVVLMTFGGLIAAYVVIATNGALEWRPFSLPPQVWVSTVIILASSISYHFGNRSLNGDLTPWARRWFMATAGLGGLFIASQILAWLALVDRGLYMRGNPYAGFFYILTAVHAVHVLGGIAALGYVVLRTWNQGQLKLRERRKNRIQADVIGWYWHTMDGLWLLILFFLGFWK